jgi:hypothetical protein
MSFPPMGPPPGMPSPSPIIDPMTGMPIDPAMMGGPPMMGPPPMPPGGMPPDPSMMGPPPPPPEPDPPIDMYQIVLDMLRAIAEEQGKDVAAAILMSLPKETVEDILQVAVNNPEDAEFLESIIPQKQGPTYPSWFVTPRKPTKAEVEELTHGDHTEWAVVRDRIDRDLKFLHMEAAAVKDNFDPDYDHEYVSPAMSDEVRAIAAMLGAIEPTYEVPWYKPDIEDATQQVEDALYCWDHEAESQYTEAGNGVYRHEVAEYLVGTGYVCSRIAFDVANPQNPFMEVLLNPATCVPTWDGSRGLLRVTQRYTSTVAAVLADFDLDGKLRKKILKTSKTVKGGKATVTGQEREPYRLTDSVNVICYYDRWWYSIIMDDVEIVPVTAHKLGFVPFIIKGSGNGEPMAITQLSTNVVGTGPGLSSSRSRLEYKNVSHFHFRYKIHAQKEEILSVIRTLFQNADNPSWLLEQDELAEVAGDPDIDNKPGGVTKLKAQHEALRELLTNPQAVAMFGPLLQAIGMDESTNRLAPEFWGVNQAANTSGNAVEGNLESGKEKLTNYLLAMQSFYAERASMRLRWFRDWGHEIENDYGEYGKLDIPYQRHRQRLKGTPPSFHLTPDTVARTGIKVKAKVTHIRLQNLAALGNAAAMWMNINAMSAREAMELRGHRDPDSVFEERRYEKALLDEDLEKALTLIDLKARDPEAAAFYQQITMAKAMGGQQGGPPGMEGPPGNFGAPNTSAMNMPALGMGQAGPTGRPAGANGAPLPGMMEPTPGGIM